MKLTILHAGKKKTFELGPEKTYILGRNPDCDIHINDQKISRQHVSLKIVGKDLHVTDLNSRNGFTVDNHRVKKSILESGDRFSIGKTIYLYQYEVPTLKKKKRKNTLSGKPIKHPMSTGPSSFWASKIHRFFTIILIFGLMGLFIFKFEDIFTNIDPLDVPSPKDHSQVRNIRDVQRLMGKIRDTIEEITQLTKQETIENRIIAKKNCQWIIDECSKLKINPPELQEAKNLLNKITKKIDQDRLDLFTQAKNHYKKYSTTFDIRELNQAGKKIDLLEKLTNNSHNKWPQIQALKREIQILKKQLSSTSGE